MMRFQDELQIASLACVLPEIGLWIVFIWARMAKIDGFGCCAINRWFPD
jgi:hypothetical protein